MTRRIINQWKIVWQICLDVWEWWFLDCATHAIFEWRCKKAETMVDFPSTPFQRIYSILRRSWKRKRISIVYYFRVIRFFHHYHKFKLGKIYLLISSMSIEKTWSNERTLRILISTRNCRNVFRLLYAQLICHLMQNRAE